MMNDLMWCTFQNQVLERSDLCIPLVMSDSLDSIMHVVTAWVPTVSHCMSFHPDPLSVDGDADFLIWYHQETALSIDDGHLQSFGRTVAFTPSSDHVPCR